MRRVLPAIALLLVEATAMGESIVYDLAADFSFEKSHSGAWQYGYSATKSLAHDQFKFYEVADNSSAVSFWHPSSLTRDDPGYYPYAAGCSSKFSQTQNTGAWAVRPGEIAMEASNTGQYSLIRFVAPQTGQYQVSAAFAGIHFGSSTTDVHVLCNEKSLFSADVDGYGGDPMAHTIVGKNPKVSYLGSLSLKIGDILTFAVGYGKNQSHYSDTTGLSVRIERSTGSTSTP